MFSADVETSNEDSHSKNGKLLYSFVYLACQLQWCHIIKAMILVNTGAVPLLAVEVDGKISCSYVLLILQIIEAN